MINKLFQKAFLGDRYFTIALRRRNNDSILETGHFCADYVFSATHEKWCADPFLIDADNRTFLFYEAVIANKGRLEAVEIFDDGSISEPTVILESEHHYSYPFVFSIEDEWYMIPESSEEKEIRLYRATAFPFKWKLQHVLLREKAVDTTVIKINGSLYLLSFLLQPKTERVVPKCFLCENIETAPKLTEVPWNAFDSLRVRGAGKVFEYDGKRIRPYQISRENIYGEAVGFREFMINQGTVEEAECCEIHSDAITLPIKKWYDGLHSYSLSQKYEAIDVRCRDFDFLKLINLAYRKFQQRHKNGE